MVIWSNRSCWPYPANVRYPKHLGVRERGVEVVDVPEAVAPAARRDSDHHSLACPNVFYGDPHSGRAALRISSVVVFIMNTILNQVIGTICIIYEGKAPTPCGKSYS